MLLRRYPGAGSRPGLRLRIRRGGRGRPAKDGTRSRACTSGWRLACLWALSSVASTSKINPAGSVRSGPPPATHTRAPSIGTGSPEPLELGSPDPVQHPVGPRVRGDRTEQSCLVPQPGEVSQAVPAVGEGDRKVGEHPARQVHRPALVGVDQRRRLALGQARLIGQLPQQGGAGVRHDPGSIRGQPDEQPRPRQADRRTSSPESERCGGIARAARRAGTPQHCVPGVDPPPAPTSTWHGSAAREPLRPRLPQAPLFLGTARHRRLVPQTVHYRWGLRPRLGGLQRPRHRASHRFISAAHTSTARPGRRARSCRGAGVDRACRYGRTSGRRRATRGCPDPGR